LKGVPVSFILSPNGEIAYVETGYTTEAGLRLRLWLSTFINGDAHKSFSVNSAITAEVHTP
jgi:hypothetical protein